MKKPKDMILTAGPSISDKEVTYVLDAVKNGWNRNWSGYLKNFSTTFAKYVGRKHAIPTCGGTGAIHLALATLGVGEGDEVILPELTYFSVSDAIIHLGAKPVFVDVNRDTWCIDSQKIEQALTEKTKAIIPVYLYGNVPENNEILSMSQKHNIPVVEDACPAVGSEYHGKKAGSFGEFSAFSFQGAKIVVTGSGGMLVTDDDALYEKAHYLNEHGEDPNKKFWQTSVAYRFEMSNLQAALGLAQIERADEFVDKKRKIWNWYKEGLDNVDGISLNVEKENTKSNFWMSSIILDKDFGISRDQVITKLRKKYNVDSRPFFYPISMFPMYEEQDSPNAHHVGLQGINLPSGLNLTKEEVQYVAASVKKVLGV